MKAKAVWLLRPPRGQNVRRMTAFFLLAVAIPRLPFWPGPETGHTLTILSSTAFGWLSLLTAIALLATGNRWRLHWTGRVVALLAFATWTLLAFATVSWTSRFIGIIIMWAMFGEITAQRE